MHGTVHIIPTNTQTPHKILHLTRSLTPQEFADALGGNAEMVPTFDTIIKDGKVSLCFTFCDEDGKTKGLAENQWATTLWRQSLTRRFGLWHTQIQDVLRGPIVVITGDKEFMEDL